MKFTTTLTLSATAAQLILAQPHGHAHHHKKHMQNVSVVKRDTATVYVNKAGDVMPLEDVCAGLTANTIKFMDGYDAPDDLCNSPTPAVSPSEQKPEETPEQMPEETPEEVPEEMPEETPKDKPEDKSEDKDDLAGGAAFYEADSSEESESQPSSATEPSSSESSSSGENPSKDFSSSEEPSKNSSSGGKGLDAEFPDGEIDCDTFPSDYGALPVDYLGHDGWAGIQKVSIANNMVQDIVTGIDGDGCTEGAMCSYACPPGYLKSQWPSTQGATGQSVGGLECSDGKLKLTNPDFSKSLCVQGTGGVKAKNKADEVIAICRTDYPGTESETIPVAVEPGDTEELACPDSGTYYKWKGMATSAQYYLNPIGVSAEKACRWGKAGSKMGNWAPINFGVSKKDGTTWLSIFQNKPTTDALYEGTVEIKGNIEGSCKYKNGQYCGATGCNKDGCTVSLSSGEATYVVS